MFRRLGHNLPEDPSYPSNLTALGYALNDKGQFVDQQGGFFQFFISDSDRANQVHKEAMHECMRAAVLEELEGLGVKPVYLCGTEILGATPPAGQHVAILATELAALRTKKHVVVVVNEASTSPEMPNLPRIVH